MIVCICHRVSDRDIAEMASDGVCDLDGLRAATGLASTCGTCADCARMVLHEVQQSRSGNHRRQSTACVWQPAPCPPKPVMP